ncbi:XRE family transcriptional regulator [Bacteroides sp. 214]|uniref:LexA family transcriptional regulator n=1 Tax=Bacteroides sp. 214 TaxID=2302935 RepID=UPI0013D4162C|nr:XRE family transcriptional regulator [Bacteroides sp. 214]NDW13431.1 XRE family transcriptional regulator [Bacteroides sp. 214]
MNKTGTIGERIALLVERFGQGRNTKLAILIGSSEGNIRGYINKGVIPKQDVLERIVRSLGVSTRWLLLGEGPILAEECEKQIREYQDTAHVPIVEIAAAAGVLGYDNSSYIEVADTINIPYSMLARNKKYFCIRVKGESMAPTLLDSGYLIVRLLERSEWHDMRDKYVYVISTTEGLAYVKRVKNRLNQMGFIVCTSDNPDKVSYPNFNLREEELHSVLCVEWYFTAKTPNIHETYYKKVEDLEDKYDYIQMQLEEIRKKMG